MDGEELQRSLKEAVTTLKGELDSQTFVSTIQEMASLCQGVVQHPGDRSRQSVSKASMPLVVASESAKVMLYLAGFVEIDDNMSLPDDPNLARMEMLLDILQQTLKRASTLSQMANTGTKIEARVRTYNSSESVESGDPLTVVAHLSYHYFMRWFLISTNVNPTMVVSFNSQIRVSMEGIEMATRTLDIMKPGSAAHATWTALKQDVLHQLQEAQNMTGMQQKADLINEMLTCASEILEELKRNSPPVCVTMFFYMHLTKMIMMVTTAGHMVSREDANRYIQTSFDLPTTRFSKEYVDSIDKVRNFCLRMQEKELASDELAQLCEIVTWQSNEFLEHFKSLAEPSSESGLPRCRYASLSTMSSQLSGVLTGSSSKSSSSDAGGLTFSSFPGVGHTTGTQQGTQALDQVHGQDLQMPTKKRGALPLEDANHMQAMVFDNKGGHRLGEDSTSELGPTKNRPQYQSVLYDSEEDAALDKELYDNSDEDLDITEKEDCETEKEKKFQADEKATEDLSCSVEHTKPVVTTSQQSLQMNQSEQGHMSIQPLQQRLEGDLQSSRQHQAQLQYHQQALVQPDQQKHSISQQSPLVEEQESAETHQCSEKGQPKQKELTKAAQAAMARHERMKQQQQQQQQQVRQDASTPSSKQQTKLPGSQRHKSVVQLKSSVQSSGRSADSTDNHQVKTSSETSLSESASGSSSQSSSRSANQNPTTQSSLHQTVQKTPTDAAGTTFSVTPLGPQQSATHGSQLRSQTPNSQPSIRKETQPIDAQSLPTQGPVHKPDIDGVIAMPSVTAISTPVVKPSAQPAVGQPHVEKSQPFSSVNRSPSAASTSCKSNGQGLGVTSPDSTATSLTSKSQRVSNPATSSSVLGDRPYVTKANRCPPQASESDPSAIPDQFRSMSMSRLPQLLESMKTDTDAEEGLKIIEKLVESKEESLSVKEKEQKVLQEHLSKWEAPVVANTLQKSLDQKCEEVQWLKEDLDRLAAAKARANDIIHSAREVELTELDPEFLYGILESFLKRIENDHDTMVKVLKAWLDYAPRQVLVEICDLLEIEREGDDPKVWVQKIREREQEVEEGELAD